MLAAVDDTLLPQAIAEDLLDQTLNVIAGSRTVLQETLSAIQYLVESIGGGIGEPQLLQVVHVSLAAVKEVSDWALRKQALETLHMLGTVVKGYDASKLQAVQPIVWSGLEAAKVDRIVHVRNLANTCAKLFGESDLASGASVLNDQTNSAHARPWARNNNKGSPELANTACAAPQSQVLFLRSFFLRVAIRSIA